MKRSIMVQKGTPVVPSLFLIGTVLFWFVMMLTDNGEWVIRLSGLSFEGLTVFEGYIRILSLVSPLVMFVAMLFLAEKSVYWIFPALLFPLAQQISNYIYNIESPEALLENPIQFAVPFLMFFFFALTVLRILPTKWIFLAFCVIAALLPVGLSLFGVGEYVYSVRSFNYSTYSYVLHNLCDWSDIFYNACYCLALGSMVFTLHPPEESTESV